MVILKLDPDIIERVRQLYLKSTKNKLDGVSRFTFYHWVRNEYNGRIYQWSQIRIEFENEKDATFFILKHM